MTLSAVFLGLIREDGRHHTHDSTQFLGAAFPTAG